MVSLMELDDDAADEIFPTSQPDLLVLENQLLMSNAPQGQMIQVLPDQNHEQHLQSHTLIPNPTQAMIQHTQMHQKAMMQLEQARQQSQEINQGQEVPVQ